MAYYKISSVHCDFLKKAGELIRMVLREATKPVALRLLPMSLECLVELAFLRIYCSYEVFLEETFILYVVGRAPESRKAIKCILNPPNRKKAVEFIREGNPWTNWSKADKVRERTERYFIRNNPYAPLVSWQSELDRIRKIRNAIAHSSKKSKDEFESIVRDEFGFFPPNYTVGKFLLGPKPKVSPPISCFEYYTRFLNLVTNKIAN